MVARSRRARAGGSVSILSLGLLLGGCGPAEPQPPAMTEAGALAASAPPPVAAPAVARVSDPAVLARGQRIYQTHCASCHGPRAEGASGWHRRAPDGRFPPPPLDGSGHAWHHSFAWLKRTIQEGTRHAGGGMPGWGDKLSEQDIEAVIAWFQSLWPEELYQNWKAQEENRAR